MTYKGIREAFAIAALMVVHWACPCVAGEFRLEAESAKLLPAAGGGRAFVSKVIGPSGTPVVGSFERGAALAFGSTPAAKWLKAVFATHSADPRFRKDFGQEPAYVEFFDGTNRLGRVDFPDTEGWFSWEELIVPVDFPACSDFRLVAPHKPVNLDYLILSNDAKPSRRHEDSAPPVDELKKHLLAGEYGAFDEIVFATRTFFWYKIEPRLKHYYRCITFNLTRPEKSLYLKAPLAKAAGGYGTCTNAQGQAVFASADDPDYRKLLAMIEDAQKVHNEHKRFDMPGFRPPIPYLREMQRFGVLPWNFDLEHDPVDPYALDRRYWDLDWTQLK